MLFMSTRPPPSPSVAHVLLDTLIYLCYSIDCVRDMATTTTAAASYICDTSLATVLAYILEIKPLSR